MSPLLKVSLADKLVALRKQSGLSNRPFRKVSKIPLFPNQIEQNYSHMLTRIVHSWRKSSNEIVIPMLPIWKKQFELEDGLRNDGAFDEVERTIRRTLGRAFSGSIRGVSTGIAAIAEQVYGWTNREWRRILKSISGVELFELDLWKNKAIDGFVKQNTSLINKLSTDTIEDIQNIVVRGYQQRKSVTQIAQEINQGTKLNAGRFKKSINRAKLIADDQIGKLHGQMMQMEQMQAGIKSYLWRTRKDPKVRKLHADREGKRYFWRRPPIDGHPGQPIRCRCWAEPYVRNIEREVLTTEKRSRHRELAFRL